ncbi:hypothetical protein PAXINDRAFT_100779 [Paxillus involutus ATCC 200175]|uniref:Uncharacterized protein n=1 Tax=Paxillus involutus ATCC 200175 TaxID=664439 RepID=A0A0C9TCK9_PAXIN|nr:hypothetical protein PAXINDRAFT_100779 [Paxillus involutus ATCC 200175]
MTRSSDSSVTKQQPAPTEPLNSNSSLGIHHHLDVVRKKLSTRQGWLGDYDYAWLCSPTLPFSFGGKRPRMSIITNRYVDVDAGKGVPRRRFFKSAAKWDETYGRVRLEKEPVLDPGLNGTRTGGLAALMEAGGRSKHLKDVANDEDWEDGASV